MTREVLISIKGLHGVKGNDNTAEDDSVEVFSAGRYYFHNGKHYVEYTEPTEKLENVAENDEMIVGSAKAAAEEDPAKKKSRITLRGKHLEVLQRGPATVRLVFEENTKNMCWYPTPVGNMLAGFDVGEVQVTESENLIEIIVDYALELNYEYVADSRIRIRIMAKNSGLFHLT